MTSIKRIIEDVKRNGDMAVRKYTAIFDRVKLKNFRVGEKEIKKGLKN